MWQISNPPVNGASLGSYFCVKNLTLSKSGLNNPEIIGVKVDHRQTDRQIDRSLLNPITFASLITRLAIYWLSAHLLSIQIDKYEIYRFFIFT